MEKDLKIYKAMTAEAAKVFEKYVTIDAGKYSLSDLRNIGTKKECAGHWKEDAPLCNIIKIEVDGFCCEYPVNRAFEMAAKFQAVASVPTKEKAVFVRENIRGRACASFTVTNKLYNICAAVKKDILRPVMEGVLIDVENRRAVASDGHILACVSLDDLEGDATNKNIILPASFIKKAKGQKVTVYAEERDGVTEYNASAENGAACDGVTGLYPNYIKVFRGVDQSCKMDFKKNANAIKKAVKDVCKLAGEPERVKISAEAYTNKLNITAQDYDGHSFSRSVTAENICVCSFSYTLFVSSLFKLNAGDVCAIYYGAERTIYFAGENVVTLIYGTESEGTKDNAGDFNPLTICACEAASVEAVAATEEKTEEPENVASVEACADPVEVVNDVPEVEEETTEASAEELKIYAVPDDIRKSVYYVVLQRIDAANSYDGFTSNYANSYAYSHKKTVLRDEYNLKALGVRVKNNRVFVDGVEVAKIIKKYAQRKINGTHKQLKPVIEYYADNIQEKQESAPQTQTTSEACKDTTTEEKRPHAPIFAPVLCLPYYPENIELSTDQLATVAASGSRRRRFPLWISQAVAAAVVFLALFACAFLHPSRPVYVPTVCPAADGHTNAKTFADDTQKVVNCGQLQPVTVTACAEPRPVTAAVSRASLIKEATNENSQPMACEAPESEAQEISVPNSADTLQLDSVKIEAPEEIAIPEGTPEPEQINAPDDSEESEGENITAILAAVPLLVVPCGKGKSYRFKSDEVEAIKQNIMTHIKMETENKTAWRLRLVLEMMTQCVSNKATRARYGRLLALYEHLTKNDLPNWL